MLKYASKLMLSVMRIGIGFSLLYDYLMAVVVSSVMGLDRSYKVGASKAYFL